MCYSGMLPETISAYGEAGLPHQDLATAAARFGTPVYVISMADVDRRGQPARGRVRRAVAAAVLAQGQRPSGDHLVSAWPGLGCQRGLDRGMAARRGGRCVHESVAFEGLARRTRSSRSRSARPPSGRPVRWLAIESAQEAAVLAGLADDAGLGVGGRPPLDVLLRLNPEVDAGDQARVRGRRPAEQVRHEPGGDPAARPGPLAGRPGPAVARHPRARGIGPG